MKGNETKEKIIRTAIILFGEFGYNNVSVQQIAEQVGIRSSSLYNHFDSKEAIFNSAIDRASHTLNHLRFEADDIHAMLHTQTPYQILRRFVTYYQEEDSAYRMAIYRLFYMEMYSSYNVFKQMHDYFVQQPVQNLVCALDVLMDIGAIPKGDSLALAELWNRTSLIFGYMAAHGPENVESGEYEIMTDFFIQMIMRGVQPIDVSDIEMDWGVIYPPAPRRKQPTDTKELILYTALDLFSQHGYASVSMRQIAKACGIKASSIYNHFSGKSNIIEEIANHFLANFKLHNITDSTFSHKLRRRDLKDAICTLSCFYDPVEYADINKVYRILFRERYSNETLGKIFLETLERDKQMIADAIDDLVNRGICVPCESHKVATAYIHTMCSLSIGSTVDTYMVSEVPLHLRTVSLLVSLVTSGYLNPETPIDDSVKNEKIPALL